MPAWSRASVIGRIDGCGFGNACLRAGVDGDGDWRRIGRGAQGAGPMMFAAISPSTLACGRWLANDNLIVRFISSTRAAILMNAVRMVANVAPRQRDRFGAAMRNECSSPVGPHVQDRRNWFACHLWHAVLSERV